MKEIEALLLL
ncbi:Protein of unknown function [Bacillus mycoides]|nr:Protein of unknown function [Bacillus mycoides]